jgi:TnpA family transposase
METKTPVLSKRNRSPLSPVLQEFSDEEMARDWTLSGADREELGKYRTHFQLFLAVQLCAVRLYGRFLHQIHEFSPRIINYLGRQLELPPALTVAVPERKATESEQRQQLLDYLGFRKFDEESQTQLTTWLEQQARLGVLPEDLLPQAEHYLLSHRFLFPGPSVLERLIIHTCAVVHDQVFATVGQRLSPELRQAMDHFLTVSEGEQRSHFYRLKEYPPAATISSLQTYVQRYHTIAAIELVEVEPHVMTPTFLEYLFKLTKRYSAADLKRFADHKRYTLMLGFLLETRKVLLDHLVQMHEQYLLDLCRHAKIVHEQQHRALRKRQKKAIDIVLATTSVFLDWPDEAPLSKQELWQQVDEGALREALEDLRTFKRLEERGYGDLLLARYPSLRKYFAEFLQLPFAAAPGSEPLLQAIELVRQLDAGIMKKLPPDAPTAFVPPELYRALRDQTGNINRNAWETGLALAIKDALRSGDLYLPQSKHHVSFWDLTLSETRWQEVRTTSYTALQQPSPQEIRAALTRQFHDATQTADERFVRDDFATIEDGHLKLKRDDKVLLLPAVTTLQKVLDARLPSIRIEQLLLEVDQQTQFSQHFTPLRGSQSRPQHFYRTLLATLISQATNLGVVSMSASVKGTTVDMLRHVLHDFVREDTLTAASAEIVNHHHSLPLSAVHGSGTISSSDAQRFGIRASSLLASYYPRYYGYYEKAIGIYTHISDQYSVFSTKVISCSPREALYVLDGLLENNTILQIREHTTDTHGYTEIIFALCYLLGYYFMPRIRDLKDQQLYRIDRPSNAGVFTSLLTKIVDLDIVEEQWDAMLRVALSLKQRTAPAHVIVQRLTNSFPSDRLSKAITNLGRIIKTEYILRYLTDPELRRTVQLQLNKGEYRHKLPRRIFFADQGEFTTGDYEEIMNKASCLSLVSNAILYWNTRKITDIVDNLRQHGAEVANNTLAHISLLPVTILRQSRRLWGREPLKAVNVANF